MTMKMMRYKPMLAQPVGDYSRIKSDDWPLYTQPKLDGVRCLIQCDLTKELQVKPIAYSRTGKEWKNISHILAQLKPFFKKYLEIVLDGELYNHDLRDNFEKIISLVRKTKPTDEDRIESAEKVHFHCYDFIPSQWLGQEFEFRNHFIKKHLNDRFPSIITLPYEIVHNTEEVEVQHEELLEKGYEGSILRKNAPYECKRSWNLMKVKDFSDAEATIIGFEEGKGKRAGHLGKFIMRDDEGVEFGCPPGKGYNYKDMKNLLFRAPHYIGARATFTYFERTKKGSYRHPLFKSIRDYE